MSILYLNVYKIMYVWTWEGVCVYGHVWVDAGYCCGDYQVGPFINTIIYIKG